MEVGGDWAVECRGVPFWVRGETGAGVCCLSARFPISTPKIESPWIAKRSDGILLRYPGVRVRRNQSENQMNAVICLRLCVLKIQLCEEVHNVIVIHWSNSTTLRLFSSSPRYRAISLEPQPCATAQSRTPALSVSSAETTCMKSHAWSDGKFTSTAEVSTLGSSPTSGSLRTL